MHRQDSENNALELVSLADRLLKGVEALHAFQPAATSRVEVAGHNLRENLIFSLRTKILPELRAKSPLPVFVGVQGGTNVGKSTVFNALAGHLISPSLVQACATKHALVFAHEKWRHFLLEEDAYPGLECRPLEDPKELLIDGHRSELL